MEWLSKITDFFKFTTKQHLIVAFTTGAMLFLPASLLKRLGLDAIPAPYSALIGIAFIVSSVFVIVNCAARYVEWYRRAVRDGKRLRRLYDRFLDLDIAEKATVREFLVQDQTVIPLPVAAPVVVGLETEGIIRRMGTLGEHSLYGPLLPYRLAEEVLPLMTADTLGIPRAAVEPDADGRLVLTERGLHWAFENRPEFAYDIANSGPRRRRAMSRQYE